MNLKRIFLWGLISSLVASGLLGIVIFLFADFNALEVKILFTTLDIGACSLAALCCATIINGRFHIFSIIGITVSALCMAALIYTIWNYEHIENYDWILALVVLTGTCSHISLILLTRTSTQVTIFVLWATVIFIATVGGMLQLLIWQKEQGDFFYRLLGVFAILDVLGTIITPILGKTQKDEDALD